MSSLCLNEQCLLLFQTELFISWNRDTHLASFLQISCRQVSAAPQDNLQLSLLCSLPRAQGRDQGDGLPLLREGVGPGQVKMGQIFVILLNVLIVDGAFVCCKPLTVSRAPTKLILLFYSAFVYKNESLELP